MAEFNEKQWQRESDAHTLAEAETIKNTPARLKGAQKEARKMAKAAETTAKSLSKVAGRKSAPRKAAPRKATSSVPRSGGAVVRSNTNIPGVTKRR